MKEVNTLLSSCHSWRALPVFEVCVTSVHNDLKTKLNTFQIQHNKLLKVARKSDEEQQQIIHQTF